MMVIPEKPNIESTKLASNDVETKSNNSNEGGSERYQYQALSVWTSTRLD